MLWSKELRLCNASFGCRELNQGGKNSDTVFGAIPKIDRRCFGEISCFYTDFRNPKAEIDSLAKNFSVKDKSERVSQKWNCFKKLTAVGAIAGVKLRKACA